MSLRRRVEFDLVLGAAVLALGVWFLAPFIAAVGAGLLLIALRPLERWRAPIATVWWFVLGAIALINATLADSRFWTIASAAAGLLLISAAVFMAATLLRRRSEDRREGPVRSGQ